MRGRVVCSMRPATFFTSLGLMEAAMTRTMAVDSVALKSGRSTTSSCEGWPKRRNSMARMGVLLLGSERLCHGRRYVATLHQAIGENISSAHRHDEKRTDDCLRCRGW